SSETQPVAAAERRPPSLQPSRSTMLAASLESRSPDVASGWPGRVAATPTGDARSCKVGKNHQRLRDVSMLPRASLRMRPLMAQASWRGGAERRAKARAKLLSWRRRFCVRFHVQSETKVGEQ